MSELSITLKSSTSLKILSCSLQEYAAMISIKHVIQKLELCNIEQNLITPYPFYSNFDDTYQIFVQLEHSVN